MLEVNNVNNDIENIVVALSKKSKSTLSYYPKALKRQALYFAPAYRDFIYKVIRNSSLKIINSFDDSYIHEINTDEEIKEKLTKRKRNKIVTNINDNKALAHELGHAVDFWFGIAKSLTKTVVIYDNKTLHDIFTEELEDCYEELYEVVMNEYKNIINSNINDKAYDILINNMPRYQELCSIPVNLKDKEITVKRLMIQKELYLSNFVETYYQLYERKCFSILNDKYAPILDALSSKYNFEGLCLAHHKESYYKNSKYLPTYEFFANLFSAKVTSRHVYVDNLIKYLPKSFDAFEKLFVIFYDHIQNNKRFTDVNLKKAR